MNRQLTRKLLSLRYVHWHKTIFSATGIWDKTLTNEMKKDIESHWRPILNNMRPKNEEKNVTAENKMYILSMFPYPSGRLHMGHFRVYTISDCFARYYRLTGKNVIHPIGWDAFGLPAENAAIERGELADVWTENNIAYMKKQLEFVGCSFDWEREIATCQPQYYKWTQYIFLRMLECGFAYQKMGLVNWDPVDKTVLANEQVDEFGCSWRSGATVEKKLLKQWFLKSTKLALSLSEGLQDKKLRDWHSIIKIQQNWIGDCDGWRFEFKLKHDVEELGDLSVWTSKPEVIFGTSFIAVKPDHPLTRHKEDSSGIFLPLTAIHPFTLKLIPLVVINDDDFPFAADCRLGIPCNNDQDRNIAVNLELPCVEVIEETGILKNSQQFSGLEEGKAREEICKFAQEHNFGGYQTSSRLQDWLISRQRYWGTPIPIIHCPKCKAVPVPYKDLPVVLPKFSKALQGAGMASPLKQVEEWVNVPCPRCGGPAKRETDTMDTFTDSSWYFLRYLDPRNDKEPFDPSIAKEAMPVDIYIGGQEHALLHLFSSRFVYHFLHSEGLVPKGEPFRRLLMLGMVKSESYRLKDSGKYLWKDQIECRDSGPVEVTSGSPVTVEWEKMSKSKFNGVDPQEIFDKYSVDTSRLFMLWIASPESDLLWDIEKHIQGTWKWQRFLWLLIYNFRNSRSTKLLLKADIQENDDLLFDRRNNSIRRMANILNQKPNLKSTIDTLYELTNHLKRIPPGIIGQSLEYEKTLGQLIIMLAPFAPHFASELWTGFASSTQILEPKLGTVWDQSWPQADPNHLLDIQVMVDDKTIKILKGPCQSSEKDIRAQVLELADSVVSGKIQKKEVIHVSYCHFRDYKYTVEYVTSKKKKSKSVQQQG